MKSLSLNTNERLNFDTMLIKEVNSCGKSFSAFHFELSLNFDSRTHSHKSNQ